MPKKPDDPHRLIREAAGRYRSADGRFVVEQESPGAWYVADSLHTDELGLPLLRGPFSTLDGAKQGTAEARERKAPTAPKPRPTSWLDDLPAGEQREARRLVRLVEQAGLEDAENVARRERQSSTPVLAAELLARALADRAKDGGLTPEAAMEVLTREGFDKNRGRPPRGWRLVELDDRGRPTGRTIERR